jgi:DNA-binding transcriptional MerR regulator
MATRRNSRMRKKEDVTVMSESVAKKRPTGLRMNKLAEAAGVPKSTILYYLGQGLLPQPEKTSSNMAYYDPVCVDLVRHIQHLQKRHRLSLGEIRRMVEEHPDPSDLSLGLELHDIVFGRGRPDQVIRSGEFLRRTGLTRVQLTHLLQERLLQPLEHGRFDLEDIEMGRMYRRALEAGVQAADLAYYVEFGEKIVDREMELRSRMTGSLPYPEDAARTIEMVKDARRCRSYVIDRLFQHRVASMRDLKGSRGAK